MLQSIVSPFGVLAILLPLFLNGQRTVYPAPNATQAVAVDSHHFYTISNSRIVKRRRDGGQAVAEWSGPLQHLNSGIVWEGRLYCANSNFPDQPMASSLEIFDTETLRHVGSHSFGHYLGSFTWIDRRGQDYYLMFVHYNETGRERDLGVAYTTLVRTDSLFRRTAGWTVPDSLLHHLAPMSISGGLLLEDGRLLFSPHHYGELYLLRFPEMGYELIWEATLTVPMQGQGIARDPTDPRAIWGIDRARREVIVNEY
jgi:outer membrane protein assembly factor BamB